MKRLAAVALVVVGIAVPVCAQRMAAHGSTGGGSAVHASPVQGAGGRGMSGNVAPAVHSAAPIVPGRANVPQSFPSSPGAYRGLRTTGPVPRNYGGRPEFFRRPPARPVHPPRRPNGPWNGWGYPVGVGWIAPGYGWYDSDPQYIEDVSAAGVDDGGDGSGADALVYVDPAAAADGDAMPQDADPSQQDQPDGYGTYPPLVEQPRVSAGPARENVVTLVFKDGRPNEQVRNFMLTRTTLYITGEHEREIPVDELDLAATKKANRGSSVTFDLPVAAQ